MPNLAFRNELANGTGDVFDRDLRIDAMLIEEIDVIGFQAFERCLGNGADVLRPAVEAIRRLTAHKAEFCRDNNLIADRTECVAEEFLVREWTVGFGGIEERNAEIHSRA